MSEPSPGLSLRVSTRDRNQSLYLTLQSISGSLQQGDREEKNNLLWKALLSFSSVASSGPVEQGVFAVEEG